MRNMKEVMLDKLTIQCLAKKGLSVADAKALCLEDVNALNLPEVVRKNIMLMNASASLLSVTREIAKISNDTNKPTSVPELVVVYDPQMEAVVADAVVSEFVEEKHEIVEEKHEEVVAPVETKVPGYSEEDLRKVFESMELSGSYTTILKKVKAALDADRDCDGDLLIALAKEYAAQAKK